MKAPLSQNQKQQIPNYKPFSSRNEDFKKDYTSNSYDINLKYDINKKDNEFPDKRKTNNVILGQQFSNNLNNQISANFKRNYSLADQQTIANSSLSNFNQRNNQIVANKDQYQIDQDKRISNQFNNDYITIRQENQLNNDGEGRKNFFRSTDDNFQYKFEQQNTANIKGDNQQIFRPQIDQSPQMNMRSNTVLGYNNINDRKLPSQNLQQKFQQLYSDNQQQYKANSNNNEFYSDTLNPYDNQSSFKYNKTESNQLTNYDMEQIIMNLHNKMKNLENKYIDLANFYKKELVNKRDQSPLRNTLEETLSRRQGYGSSTQYKQQNTQNKYQQQMPELDQNVESSIINELLQEKNDLEKELGNMINIQSHQFQNEQNIVEKMQEIQNENQELKEMINIFKSQQSNSKYEDSKTNNKVDYYSIQDQQDKVIDKFEKEFIVFINSNYNSFTENDVIGMFGNLRTQLTNIIQKALRNQGIKERPIQLVENNLINNIEEIIQQQKLNQQDLQSYLDQYKIELSEFEISHEYTLQNLNKTVFDLKNKFDISKLDLKKLSLTLQTLGKNTQDLNQNILHDSNKKQQNYMMQPSYLSGQQQQQEGINVVHQRGLSGNRRSILDPRLSLQSAQIPPLSPSNSNIYQRISGEMYQQVQIMNQTLLDVNTKIGQGEKEFRNFNLLEEQSKDNLKMLKNNFERFQQNLSQIFEADQINFSQFINQQTSDKVVKNVEKNLLTREQEFNHGEDEQQNLNSQRRILELEELNEQLYLELQKSQDQFNALKADHKQNIVSSNNLKPSLSPNRLNQNKQIELNNIRLSQNYQNILEDSNGRGNYYNQPEELLKAKDRLRMLEQENEELSRTNRNLFRQLDSNTETIDKLQRECENLKLQSTINNQNQKSQKEIRNLIRVTSKFLTAMKRLQKAVHKKEQNVQQEKNEFEINRKELEQFIKSLKKDLDQQENTNSQNKDYNQVVPQPEQQYSSNYSSKIKYNPPIYNQKHYNQFDKNDTLQRKQNAQSFNIQGTNFSISNNLATNFTIQEDQQIYRQPYNNLRQKERSPIPLRQNNLMHSVTSNKVEMFRSLETVDRKPLISSIDRQQHRSPSENNNFLSSQQKLNNNNSSIEQLNQRQYITNMKSEIDLLKQEVSDLINERDHMRKVIQRNEREKDDIVQEKIILEKYIDREKKKHESNQREINDLEKEKQTLLQEFKKISQNYSQKQQPLGDNNNSNKNYNELEQQMRNLKEQKLVVDDKLDIQMKMNQEYRRTIQIMEESAEAAKEAITDLKEALSSKDIEIQEVKVQMNMQNEQNSNKINNKQQEYTDQELRKIKTHLLEQISQLNEEFEEKLEAIEQELAKRDEELSRIKRNFEQKLKEKEIQKVNQTEQEVKNKMLLLQAQIQELEQKEIQELQEVKKLKKEIDIKNKQIEDLENKNQQDKVQFENKLQQLQSKIQIVNEQLNKQEQQTKTQIDEILKKNLNENNKLKEENIQYQEQIVQLKEQLDNIQNQYEQDMQEYQQEFVNNQNTIKQLQDQLVQFQQKILESNQVKSKNQNQQNKQIETLNLQIQNYEQKNQELVNQFNFKDKQNIELLKQIEEIKNQQAKQQQDIQSQFQQMEQEKIKEIEQKNIEIKNMNTSHQQIINQNKELVKNYKKQIQDLQNEKQELQEQQQQLIHQIGSEKGEVIQQLEQEIAKYQQKNSNQKKQYINELQHKDEEISQKENDYNNLKEQYIQQQEQTGEVSKNFNEQLEQLKQNSQDLQKKLEQNIKLINQKDTTIQQYEKSINELQGKMSQIKKENQEKINQINNKIQDLQTVIKQKDVEVQNYQLQLNNLNGQIQDYQQKENQILQQNQQIESQNQQIKQYHNQIQNLQQKNKQQEIDIKNLQIQIQETSQQFQSLNEQERSRLQQELLLQKQQLIDEQNFQKQQILLEQQNEKEKIKNDLLLQKQKIQEELENANKTINSQQQTLKDIENENKYSKVMQQSLKKSLESLQKESEQQKLQTQEEKLSIEQQYSSLKQQFDNKDQQLQQQVKQFNQLQNQLQKQEEAGQKLLNQLDHLQIDQKSKLQQKDDAIKQKDNELLEQQNRYEQQIKQIIAEKDRAYQQLNDIVNQSKNENKSLEQNLQNQLNDTIKLLQNKEKEVNLKNQRISEIDKQIKDQKRQEDQLQQKIQEYEQQMQQMQQELDDAEITRQKHQLTLENNRNLIQMLKNELQKNLEKQRSQQQDQELFASAQDSELKEENDQLKHKLQTFKVDFEDKMTDLQLKLDEKESELKLQNDLIEDANKVIEEFNDEKHAIKAKFKHLIQLLDENDAEESSYKEDDQIELEECFEKLEKEVNEYKRRKEQQIEGIENEKSEILEQQKQKEEEIEKLQTQMGQIKCELMNALNKIEENDIILRNKMQNAERKIENYKEKLIEKQKYINQLELEKNKQNTDREKQQQQQQQQNLPKGDDSLLKENMELIQKLQKAENELQSYRLSSNRKQSIHNDSSQEQPSLDNLHKIKLLEEQIEQLRKQIFNAKDQVIQNLSDTFAKKIKEQQQIFQNENILKKKLAELNDNNSFQPTINLNTELKLVKKVSLGNKNLIIINNNTNNTYYLLDQQLLSYAQLEYINSFIPDNIEEQEKIQFDSKQLQIMNNLQEQINEMRDERQELKNELIQLRTKLTSGIVGGIDEIQEMRFAELEDDLGHLTVESQELRYNIKELSQKNVQLRLRILELNQYIWHNMIGQDNEEVNLKKIMELHDENDQLKLQLQRKRSGGVGGMDLEEVKMRLEEDNSFLGEMKHGDNNYFLDQSSIEGVIEGLGGNNNNNNNAMNTEQQIRPSKIQMQQKIKKLEKEVEEMQTKNKNLTAEIQRSQQQTLNPSEASVIDHIKGTLIQFLKHCPLTEKNNEELLAIVFSMMEFSKEEIQDVQTFRQKIRDASQSGTEPDEEIKKLAKKGIFNIFKKKEKEKEQKIKGSSNQSTPKQSNNQQYASPIRPIKR